jgi:hypothetical protein
VNWSEDNTPRYHVGIRKKKLKRAGESFQGNLHRETTGIITAGTQQKTECNQTMTRVVVP